MANFGASTVPRIQSTDLALDVDDLVALAGLLGAPVSKFISCDTHASGAQPTGPPSADVAVLVD
jgi:hypothetical protein